MHAECQVLREWPIEIVVDQETWTDDSEVHPSMIIDKIRSNCMRIVLRIVEYKRVTIKTLLKSITVDRHQKIQPTLMVTVFFASSCTPAWQVAKKTAKLKKNLRTRLYEQTQLERCWRSTPEFQGRRRHTDGCGHMLKHWSGDDDDDDA
jgi:hypothetical protein